jgi:hypothetical protein
LITALKELGFSIREGASLTVSNGYETKPVDFLGIDPVSRKQIGFFLGTDGDFSIAGSGIYGINNKAIEAEVIKIENRIKREYARSVVKKKLSEQGFFLVNESENNDSIVIKLSRIV